MHLPATRGWHVYCIVTTLQSCYTWLFLLHGRCFPFHLANLMHEILWGVKVHMLEMYDVMALGMMKRSADLRRRATCCCATCCCVTCCGRRAMCCWGTSCVRRAVCDALCEVTLSATISYGEVSVFRVYKCARKSVAQPATVHSNKPPQSPIYIYRGRRW